MFLLKQYVEQDRHFLGFGAGILVVIIGALIGGTAGYYGGRIDDVLSLLINIFLVMPGLPLMVILASWLPPSPATLLGVLVLTGWAWNARVIRSQMMTFRNRDFVSAAVITVSYTHLTLPTIE